MVKEVPKQPQSPWGLVLVIGVLAGISVALAAVMIFTGEPHVIVENPTPWPGESGFPYLTFRDEQDRFIVFRPDTDQGKWYDRRYQQWHEWHGVKICQ